MPSGRDSARSPGPRARQDFTGNPLRRPTSRPIRFEPTAFPKSPRSARRSSYQQLRGPYRSTAYAHRHEEMLNVHPLQKHAVGHPSAPPHPAPLPTATLPSPQTTRPATALTANDAAAPSCVPTLRSHPALCPNDTPTTVTASAPTSPSNSRSPPSQATKSGSVPSSPPLAHPSQCITKAVQLERVPSEPNHVTYERSLQFSQAPQPHLLQPSSEESLRAPERVTHPSPRQTTKKRSRIPASLTPPSPAPSMQRSSVAERTEHVAALGRKREIIELCPTPCKPSRSGMPEVELIQQSVTVPITQGKLHHRNRNLRDDVVPTPSAETGNTTPRCNPKGDNVNQKTVPDLAEGMSGEKTIRTRDDGIPLGFSTSKTNSKAIRGTAQNGNQDHLNGVRLPYQSPPRQRSASFLVDVPVPRKSRRESPPTGKGQRANQWSVIAHASDDKKGQELRGNITGSPREKRPRADQTCHSGSHAGSQTTSDVEISIKNPNKSRPEERWKSYSATVARQPYDSDQGFVTDIPNFKKLRAEEKARKRRKMEEGSFTQNLLERKMETEQTTKAEIEQTRNTKGASERRFSQEQSLTSDKSEQDGYLDVQSGRKCKRSREERTERTKEFQTRPQPISKPDTENLSRIRKQNSVKTKRNVSLKRIGPRLGLRSAPAPKGISLEKHTSPSRKSKDSERNLADQDASKNGKIVKNVKSQDQIKSNNTICLIEDDKQADLVRPIPSHPREAPQTLSNRSDERKRGSKYPNNSIRDSTACARPHVPLSNRPRDRPREKPGGLYPMLASKGEDKKSPRKVETLLESSDEDEETIRRSSSKEITEKRKKAAKDGHLPFVSQMKVLQHLDGSNIEASSAHQTQSPVSPQRRSLKQEEPGSPDTLPPTKLQLSRRRWSETPHQIGNVSDSPPPCLTSRARRAQQRASSSEPIVIDLTDDVDENVAKISVSQESVNDTSVSVEGLQIRESSITPIEGERGSYLEKLSDEEQKLIDVVFKGKPDHEKVVKIPETGIVLRRADLKRLRGTRWLNDEVINAYVALINRRNREIFESETGPPEGMPRTFIFNTYFFTRLCSTGYDYKGVARWTKRAKLDVLKQDLILVPVNLGNHHWILSGIDMSEKKFLYLDSMEGRDKHKVVGTLRRWLMDELKDKHDAQVWEKLDVASWGLKKGEYTIRRSQEIPGASTPVKWNGIRPSGIPRQFDGGSCGVFTAKIADCLSLGIKVYFSQKDITLVRSRMALDLVHTKIAE